MKPEQAYNDASEGKGRERPFLLLVNRLIQLIALSGKIVAAASIVILFSALLCNVILRYFFGSGIAWAYEIHAVLLPWLVAGGLLIAAARGANIAISILPDLVQPRLRRVILIGIEGSILVIVLTVLHSSLPILKASRFQALSTLGIKQVWGYASIYYAFAGMGLIAALEVVRLLFGGSVQDLAIERRSLS
ncbi:TRAP transporter small permease [Sedimentimonas flavescens]|uniref:TRAP transporter small permease n=1 Tax=Sedimentimonas flavescens TaxID=2851012 RepID=UPI001C4A58B5|nr:TRAP transporter small permease subunit [Sedimentimonas flavescens]MBW0159649.1 TRAP transporter small permease subunit [Sedimentimonas flavescens]